MDGYDRGVETQESAEVRQPRVGVMGGTFDPIHLGHLSGASEVADRLALDEVVFVPTGEPWQKADSRVSDAEDRYAMTMLACAAHPKFRVSRVDIDRVGPTYTADTLRDLREQYAASARLFFITGADTLANVGSWKEPEEVFALANFVMINRPGYDLAGSWLRTGAEVVTVDTPSMDISSSDCRSRAGAGRSLWYLLPENVVRYVHRRGLYGGP